MVEQGTMRRGRGYTCLPAGLSVCMTLAAVLTLLLYEQGGNRCSHLHVIFMTGKNAYKTLSIVPGIYDSLFGFLFFI